MTSSITLRISLVTLVVRDYDEAIDFYVGKLGFELRNDTVLASGKRWVVVAPGPAMTGLLLARAASPDQAKIVGEQSGGRVFLFLKTSDFGGDYERFRSRGIRFVEEPRWEPYGMVVVFEDLYGNRWDLIERRD